MFALLLSIFLDLVGFGLVLPLLPFYAQHFGASALEVTLLTSTYSIGQMITASPLGWLSDRFGRRPSLLLCLGVSAIAYVGLSLASSLPALFAARAISGCAAGKISIAEAWVSDLTPPERRSWGMGLVGATMAAGYVVGPAAGGFILGSGAASARWHIPAIAAAALSLGALLLALFTLREPPRAGRQVDRHRGARPPGLSAARAAARAGFTTLIALHFLVTFVFTLIEAIFPLWSKGKFGWGPLQVGVAFAAIGTLIAFTQACLIGPLTRRFGEVRVLLIGLLHFTLGLALSPAVNGVGLLAVMLCLVSVGISTVMPTMTSLLTQGAPSGEQGAVLGVANSSAGLGRILGPAWAGWVLERFGLDMPYGLSAVIMFFALLWARRARRALTRDAPAGPAV